MNKLAHRGHVSGWRPAHGLGAPAGTVSNFLELAAGPAVVGAGGVLASNVALKKSVPELAGVINLVGTVVLFAFVPNKFWGIGAGLATVVAYATRKMGGE